MINFAESYSYLLSEIQSPTRLTFGNSPIAPNKFKTVQSHNNLGAYQQVEVTRIVSERTVCYCSNFDLCEDEWFQDFKNIKIFSENLRKNLGKSNS